MGRVDEMLKYYAASKRKLLLTTVLFFTALTIMMALLDIKFGSGVTISLHEIASCKEYRKLAAIRCYRVVTGVFVGIILGESGFLLQTILRNPLVDPYILGVSSGAFLGSITAYLLNLPLGPASLCIFSFAGGLFAVTLVYNISRIAGMSELSIVLAGVAVSTMFSSISVILLILFPQKTLGSLAWSFGSLSLSTVKTPILLTAGVIPILALAVYRIEWLRNTIIGDEYARVRGVDVKRLKVEVMIISSWSVAIATASVGPIGFVGLMVPHIARMLIGGDVGAIAVTVVPLAPALLLAGDVLARNIMPPNDLPVGLITSLFGAPFFLYLLVKSKRRFM